jgi:hypothetical protein
MRLLLKRAHERTDLVQHGFIAFAQPRSDDVLAYDFTPQMVAAITSRMIRGYKIHPVSRVSTGHSIPAISNRLANELNSSLHTAKLDSDVISFPHLFLCSAVV